MSPLAERPLPNINTLPHWKEPTFDEIQKTATETLRQQQEVLTRDLKNEQVRAAQMPTHNEYESPTATNVRNVAARRYHKDSAQAIQTTHDTIKEARRTTLPRQSKFGLERARIFNVSSDNVISRLAFTLATSRLQSEHNAVGEPGKTLYRLGIEGKPIRAFFTTQLDTLLNAFKVGTIPAIAGGILGLVVGGPVGAAVGAKLGFEIPAALAAIATEAGSFLAYIAGKAKSHVYTTSSGQYA